MRDTDYHVDIQGVPTPQRRVIGGDTPRSTLHGRPWLAVRWECCSAYTRIYRNAAGTAYEGKCPRCGRAVSVKVGPGGTDQRFFVAK